MIILMMKPNDVKALYNFYFTNIYLIILIFVETLEIPYYFFTNRRGQSAPARLLILWQRLI